MDRYDYTNNNDQVSQLSVMLDDLSQDEAIAAIKAVEAVRQSYPNKRQQYEQWFDVTLSSILKDFSELTDSLLTIKKIDKAFIIVTIQNKHGIDITASSTIMKFTLALANHIAVNISDDMATLTLIFDCSNID